MIPTNEQGVIVLFAQQVEKAGLEIVSVRTKFPDAIVRKNGVEYRAEFEFQSSNFKAHKHDVRKCDIIICWKRDSKSILPILALSEEDWECADMILPSENDREIEYWKQRALLAEGILKRSYNRERVGQSNQIRGQNRQEALAALLAYLAEHPEASFAEMGRSVGRSKSWAIAETNGLTAAGKLHRNGQGWEVRNA